MCCLLLSFLCFKQKSAYEMRISDWSSDVCSSDLARALALRAYESSPNSAAGLFAMARANFYSGNCAGGNAMGEAALALNPYDADMSGFLGLFKLACGQADEGEALLRRSLQLRSEEHTSELQSLMRISYAVFCLTKTKPTPRQQ